MWEKSGGLHNPNPNLTTQNQQNIDQIYWIKYGQRKKKRICSHLSCTSTPSCRNFSAPAALLPGTAEDAPPPAPVALSGVLAPGGDVAVSPGAITNLLKDVHGAQGGESWKKN